MAKITIGQLTLNIHEFSYPKASDPFDSDWLNVQVECKTEFADISFSGVFLPYSQLAQFGHDVDRLYRSETSVAIFEPLEPSVIIELKKIGNLGGIVFSLELEPVLGSAERYVFEFQLDQSFLPEIVSSIKSAMASAEAQE
ncbi:MAG: hypothetical protein COB08_005355 [Rhodobacteraceae bacterium]|nr:hypothetical protein [Paracoccaceae bacterium]